MQRHQIIALLLSTALVGGCQSQRPQAAPAPASTADNSIQGTVVGDDRTAMEVAVETAGARGPRRRRHRQPITAFRARSWAMIGPRWKPRLKRPEPALPRLPRRKRRRAASYWPPTPRIATCG